MVDKQKLLILMDGKRNIKRNDNKKVPLSIGVKGTGILGIVIN